LIQFTPAHLSTVRPQSTFSFLASSLTNPDSINVDAKGLFVEIDINNVNKGYVALIVEKVLKVPQLRADMLNCNYVQQSQ